jgi:hypothetical protein
VVPKLEIWKRRFLEGGILNIGIVGSRGFTNYSLLKKKLDEFIASLPSPKKEIVIVSGGARGADYLAERYAEKKGYKILIFKADWDRYGASAGYIRNVDIVKNSDILFAFWDGESKGTQHTINISKKENKKMEVILYKTLVP